MIFGFQNTDQILIARLRGRAPKIVVALTNRLNKLGLRLQTKIRTEKLEGGTPLHRRTGNLARSINFVPTQAKGTTLVMKVEGAGSTAFYGRVHERGGRSAYEIVPVNKKALAFGAGEFSVTMKSGRSVSKYQILKALSSRTESSHKRGLSLFKRAPKAEFVGGSLVSAGTVVVKKVVHPPLPKRPFMAPSLEEMRPQMIEELQAEANKAAKGE